MAVNWLTLTQSVLGAAASAKYTPGAAKQGVVHTANAWNPTAAAVTLNFYLVPNGGAANDATRVHQVSAPAGKSIQIPEIIGLKIANPSQLFADGNGVTLTITGAEADAT